MIVEDGSPTARALRTLELLQRHPGLTAADLAARLGVSDRAARRYVAILREADISVDSTPGRYGGYRLGRGLELPPLVFSSTEALGLVMAVLDGEHAAADAGEPVGAALGKIINALPPDVGRQAALLREHARTAPPRRTVRPDPDTTSRLVQAAADRRQVRLGYRPRSGAAVTVLVEPWAVVVRGGLWYLLGFAHGPGAARTYRVDRVVDLAVLDTGFTPPPDLDAVDWLERHLGTGRAFGTSVVFSAPLERVAPWVSPTMGELRAAGEDSCRLTGTTDNPEMYAGEWLAAIPFPVTVEGGPELREAVGALVERLSASLA